MLELAVPKSDGVEVPLDDVPMLPNRPPGFDPVLEPNGVVEPKRLPDDAPEEAGVPNLKPPLLFDMAKSAQTLRNKEAGQLFTP